MHSFSLLKTIIIVAIVAAVCVGLTLSAHEFVKKASSLQ